jgi:hypothetical protein
MIMKKMICLTLMLVALGQSAFALLAPLSESIIEIRAILNSPELTQYLRSSDVIMNIEKTDSGYRIVTQQTKLTVELAYVPSKVPGPQQFNLKFKQPHDGE